jgi:hypothetical protein
VSDDAGHVGSPRSESASLAWLQQHVDYTTVPLLSEPSILDTDTTVKPLYGLSKAPW